MINLAEMLNNTYGSDAYRSMAKAYGIDPDQAQAAMQAVLPAFSMGMNNAAANPQTAANFLQMLGNTNAMAGAMAQQQALGQDILKQVFGSNDLTNAVAQHAANSTGIGSDIMKQMMPVIASMILGSFANGGGAAQNPLGAILGSLLGQGGAATQAPSNPLGDLMGQILGPMMGGAASAPKPANDPFSSLGPMGDILRQMTGAAPAAPAEEPPEEPKSLGREAAETWSNTFGRMFQHGSEVQDQHLQQLDDLFKQFGNGKSGSA